MAKIRIFVDYKDNKYRALKTKTRKIFIFFLLILAFQGLSAQSAKYVLSGRNAERIITAEGLQSQVEFLTDTLFKGRETGTRGASEAAFWIARRFSGAGLMPIGGRISRSFTLEDSEGTKIGHNIMGFMPGERKGLRETYIIVTAHYDSYGMISGNLYPGADSNASGVVAMLSIADMFAKMKQLGRSYPRNIIFVALDAREKNSAGAEALWDDISRCRLKDPVSGETITPAKIHSTVVLDILGSTLSPVNKGRKDYLIMLSDGQYRYELRRANENQGLGLDLGFDYYGSKGFTEMFHSKIGDQRVFNQNGAVCVVFTSGITMKTNKTSDDALSLNYDVLRKRIFTIFHWIGKIM